MAPKHIINIDVARLDAEYEKMMDEVYLMHHTYPRVFKVTGASDSDLAAQGEADSYARNGSRGNTFGGSGSKCVRYQQADTHNGLPRHK